MSLIELESREQGEQGVVTDFGTVTDRRVIYHANKGWFSGGSREDIPLRHVTSVRVETSRHPILGVILLLLGLLLLVIGLAAPSAGVLLIAIVPLALAVLLLWGSPSVVLNTAGGDLRPSIGLPWTKDEAEKFVRAVRSQLFKDEK